MSSTPGTPHRQFLLSTIALWGLLASGPGKAEDVTYFDRPPSPEQIRAALAVPTEGPVAWMPSASANLPAGSAQLPAASLPPPLARSSRLRGIRWQQAAPNPAPVAGAGAGAGARVGAGTGSSATTASPVPPVAPLSPPLRESVAADTAPPVLPTGAASQAVAGPVCAASMARGAAIAVPVNFDSSSAHVAGASLPYVSAVAAVLLADPGLRLSIEGHTDANGDPRANILLSWDRALSVFRLLVERYGIAPERLQPVGKGSDEPLAGRAPGNGANRRVQFRVQRASI